MTTLPKVIIIGRANVGKSTLFNRLIEKPKALTSKIAGTTRDINIGRVYWQGVNFELQDTGGINAIIPSKKIKKISPSANIDFALDIIKKTQTALAQADLILFTVDTQTGLMPQDIELAKAVKKINKPVILAANKTDSLKMQGQTAEFYKLALGEPNIVSGINGLGTGDLLDVITQKLKKIKKGRRANKAEVPKNIKITIIGKPNVGKSSLLNSLTGEERAIVSPIPFTTRESIDTFLQYQGQNFIIIDTAGIRKQAKVARGLEKLSVKRGLTNAKNSDICLLVLDISQPISVQDNKLSQALLAANTSIIIVANKWDKIPDKETDTPNNYQKYIYRHFPYLTWAPIIFTSALSGKHVQKILDLALQVYDNRNIQLSPSALNKFLKRAIKKFSPKSRSGRKTPYLSNLEQVKTNPPRFEIKIRKTDNLSNAYIKYLENSLRQEFGLMGTPVKITLKK